MPKKQKTERRAKAGTPAEVGVSTKSAPTPKSRYSRFVTDILDRTTPDTFDRDASASMSEFLLPPVGRMTRVVPVGIYLARIIREGEEI